MGFDLCLLADGACVGRREELELEHFDFDVMGGSLAWWRQKERQQSKTRRWSGSATMSFATISATIILRWLSSFERVAVTVSKGRCDCLTYPSRPLDV